MVKRLYILLLLVPAMICGCNPGIIEVPQPTVSNASLYFFQKNAGIQQMTFRDSAAGGTPVTLKVSILSAAGNNFLLKETNSGSLADSVLCTIDSASVNLTGLSTHSVIPLPDGYKIKPDSGFGRDYTYPSIMHVTSSGKVIVAAASDGTIFYSSDKGSSWKQSSFFAGNPISVVASVNGSTIVAAGTQKGTLFLSSSGGASWSTIQTNSSSPVSAITTSAAGDIFFSSGEQVYRLKTPANLSPAKVASGVAATSLALSINGKDTLLVAGTADTGLWYLYLPGNQWAHVNALPPKTQIISLISSAGKFYCTTGSATYYSTTADSWDSLEISLPYGILAGTDHGTVFGINPLGSAVQIDSSVIRSLTSVPEKYVHDVALSGSEIFAATDSGIYKGTGQFWEHDTGVRIIHTVGTISPGEMTALHTLLPTALDSSWAADTLLSANTGSSSFAITGRIIDHLDSLMVSGKMYRDIFEVQYANEHGKIANTLAPYEQVFYAKNEGPVIIYQLLNSKITRMIYRVQ